MILFRTYISLMFCLTFIFSQANKEIRVQKVIGEAFIEKDISPNKARKIALNEAKIEALRQAGVGESISAQNLLFTSESNGDYKDFFTSSSQIEIRGAVKEYLILSERMYCRDSSTIIFEVIIDATVIKYSDDPDPGFTSDIQGVKEFYEANGSLEFKLKVTKDCYLTIFNITDSEAYMLYPNPYEKGFKMDALKTYDFPIGKLDYTLSNETDKTETNRLIYVFTKKPISFIKMDAEQVTSVENMFSWIYSISPDQRTLAYQSYFITK